MWLILGIILIIADIFLGFNLFVLPVGVAALITSGLIFVENNAFISSIILFENWKIVLLCFAALSIVSVGLLKIVFQRNKKNEPDINKY
tara:strand:- start:69 stop:335 length:267 start_codon:yes stop_codon:yes gene_type:complete